MKLQLTPEQFTDGTIGTSLDIDEVVALETSARVGNELRNTKQVPIAGYRQSNPGPDFDPTFGTDFTGTDRFQSLREAGPDETGVYSAEWTTHDVVTLAAHSLAVVRYRGVMRGLPASGVTDPGLATLLGMAMEPDEAASHAMLARYQETFRPDSQIDLASYEPTSDVRVAAGLIAARTALIVAVDYRAAALTVDEFNDSPLAA